MRCEFAHDDGAYVLGALSPAERSAYERHLGTCSACREAVAEIAVLPGLLGRLDRATALSLLEEETPATEPGQHRRRQPVARRDYDDDRVTSMLAAAARKRGRDRRASRLRYMSAALAAACVAMVAAFGIGILRNAQAPGGGPDTTSVAMYAMTPVDNEVPISAAVGLEETDAGTKIVMACAYQVSDKHRDEWRVSLVAYGTGDKEQVVDDWTVAPGNAVGLDATTKFKPDQLERLELRRDDGTTLLRYNVP